MANRTVTVALKAHTSGFDGPLSTSAKKVKEFQDSVTKATDKGGQDVDKMGESTSALSEKFGALPEIAGAAGAAIGAAFTYAVAKATEFDKQMRNVQSITKVSDKVLGELGEQVIELSKELPQSADTLASGLYDIASSGYSGAEGLKVLEAAATAASAGMTDTATAAQAITAVLNAYGLSADQAGDVSDQLFQTVNLGVTTFEALAHNVGDYLGQAKALGISFAQTQSAIATLTLTGTTQAQAGTALGAVLNSLIRPQEGLADAIKKTGYANGTALLQAKGFRGALMLLAQQTGGSAEAMGELFTDSMALRTALSLTGNEGKLWAQNAAKIEDPVKRAQAAQKALAEQSKSLSYQMSVARNRVDAVATSIGLKLLPVLSQGIAGMLHFGEKTTQELHQLQPQFKDLADALQNVGKFMADLGAEIAPIIEALVRLAAVPVVALFTVLAQTLATVTGFMADHRDIVLILAAAYGIALAGGIARVSWLIISRLVVAVSDAIFALEGLTGASAAARGALVLLSGTLAAVPIVALAVEGIAAWSGYTRGAREAEHATRDAKKAMEEPGDLSAFKKARDEIIKTRDAAEDFIQGQKDKSFWQSLFDVGDNAKALGLGAHLEELQQQAHATDIAWTGFINNVNQAMESKLAGSSTKAMNDFHNSMIITGKAAEEVMPALQEAGVEVGDSIGTITSKLAAYRAKTDGAAGGSAKVTEAFQDMTTGAESLDDAIDKLKEGFDQLMGRFLDADEAAIHFEAALDDLTKSVKDNGKSLDIHTEKGRANRQSIIDAIKALEDKVLADARVTGSAKEAAAALEQGREQLIKQAEAAGFTKQQIQKLLEQYHLTPREIITQIKALGLDKAKDDTAALRRNLNALDGKVVTSTVITRLISKGADTGLHADKGATGGLIRGPGTGTSDDVPLWTSNGEFLVNEQATRENLALLQALNAGAGIGSAVASTQIVHNDNRTFSPSVRMEGLIDQIGGPASVSLALQDQALKLGYL